MSTGKVFLNPLVSVILLAVLMGLSSLSAVCIAAEIAVVVHPENSTLRLAKKDVKRIFLGKKTVFPDRSAATPVDQKIESKIRNDFYLSVAGKAPPQMQTYRAKMVFSGKAKLPHVLADDNSVKQWVANHKKAIGYIKQASVDDSVKVVLTIKR